VVHLMSVGESTEHTLSRLVRNDGERLVYDAGEQEELEL